MQKKILFISQDFYPRTNGTTACLENFLPYISRKYKTTVYAEREHFKDAKVEEVFNLTVKRPKNVFDIFVYINANITQRVEKLRINKSIKNFFKLFIDVILYPFLYIAKKKGFRYVNSWESNLYRHIEKNEKLNDYDVLLAVGAPFSNIRIAYNIKKNNPHLKLILIKFDLFTHNPRNLIDDANSLDSYNLRLAEEKSWYELADHVIVTKEMYDTIRNSELNQWLNKIYPMNTPNLYNINNYNPENIFHENKNEAINIVYTGMFYEDIRNPSFSLEIFNLLCKKDPRIKLHILGFGCENIIEKFKNTMGENLIIYGHRSKQFAINARYSADILLNISNRTLSQAPSKILEYIGSCKPIINVFNLDGDLCEEYLSQYPLSISVKEDFAQLEKLAEKTYEFILKSKGLSCEFNEVAPKYGEFLPETFANKVLELIEK